MIVVRSHLGFLSVKLRFHLLCRKHLRDVVLAVSSVDEEAASNSFGMADGMGLRFSELPVMIAGRLSVMAAVGFSVQFSAHRRALPRSSVVLVVALLFFHLSPVRRRVLRWSSMDTVVSPTLSH